jgi:DNA-binding XRE family transcriptional regulator
LQKLRRGKTISLTLIVEISHVFKVSSDYLLRDPISVSAVEFRKEMQGDSTAGLASHFGRQLRRLRSEASMSQQTLAAHLGLRNHTHIANLEAGRKLPSIDLVLAVANLFSLSIDALLVQGDSPKEHL